MAAWSWRLGLCLDWALLGTLLLPAQAAPAPWYWWHSRLDSDQRVCAQFMPRQGWERGAGPFDNPHCQPGPLPHAPRR